jgi:flagellar hook-length control protein FliK
MNQTNIDYLFNLTAGLTRVPGAEPRPGEPLTPFNDHFSRASIATIDQERVSNRPEPFRAEPSARSGDGPASPDGDDGQAAQAERPAEARGDSAGNDEDPVVDHRDDEAVTSQSPGAVESSSDGEESGDVNEADAASPVAASAAAAGAQAAALNAVAVEAELAAASGTPQTEAQAANETSGNAVTRPASDVIASNRASGAEIQPHQELSAAEQSTNTAEPAEAEIKSKARTTPRAVDERLAEGKRTKPAKRGDRSESRPTAANELTPDSESLLRSTAAGRADDESILPESNEPANRDESRRPTGRAASTATSRSETMVTATAAAPAIAGDSVAPARAVATNAALTEDPSGTSIKPTGPKTDALAGMLGRGHSTGASAGRAGRAARDEDMPRVDPARFIGRVARAFERAHERGGTLQLRLSPPELGSLRLELTVKDGAMTATLETETTAARRVLLDHLPALRDRLAELNIRVERFDVDVRRDGGGGQADGRGGQHQQQNHQADQPPPRRPAASQARIGEAAASETSAARPRTSNAQINLVA